MVFYCYCSQYLIKNYEKIIYSVSFKEISEGIIIFETFFNDLKT